MNRLKSESTNILAEDSHRYLDAVEGLIFDPQVYHPIYNDEQANRIARLNWESVGTRYQPAIPIPEFTPIYLKNRWWYIKKLYQELAVKGQSVSNNSKAMFGNYYYEKRSTTVTVGSNRFRKYLVQLNLVGETPYLNVKQHGLDGLEVNLLFQELGIQRALADGRHPPFAYLPAFAEQQRLFILQELLSK